MTMFTYMIRFAGAQCPTLEPVHVFNGELHSKSVLMLHAWYSHSR